MKTPSIWVAASMSVNAEPSGKPVAEQAVDDRQLAVGALGARVALDDRHQVLEIAGPGIGHFHPASRLRPGCLR